MITSSGRDSSEKHFGPRANVECKQPSIEHTQRARARREGKEEISSVPDIYDGEACVYGHHLQLSRQTFAENDIQIIWIASSLERSGEDRKENEGMRKMERKRSQLFVRSVKDHRNGKIECVLPGAG
ncbi:hypothetical protein M0804_005573 [Polistes exclamans]|nr:hypothetical protein M0804_005573 [Polistes exclamans]